MRIMMRKLNTNTLLYVVGGIAAIFVITFIVWFFRGSQISIINGSNKTKVSPITSEPCEYPDQRPVAIMMAADPVARPLSGIAQADLVFEMPVTPNGVTRMMAVFQCHRPKEIGSIRSARSDFIPLAASVGAILAHWGGEKEALQELDSHVIDNVDAMKYEGTTFWRKSSVKPPHNGFTTIQKLLEKAGELDYPLTNTFSGYPHGQQERKNLAAFADSVAVNYPDPYNILWTYNEASKRYARSRAGTPELDVTTNGPVQAGVVILLETSSVFLRDQYISVTVAGQGQARIYQNGTVTSAIWKRDAALGSKLSFSDTNGKEIPLASGPLWIEILTQ